MTVEEFDSAKKQVLASIGNTLIEKNTRYGNAALSPVNVFFKGDATTSILIRLDDKYSRVLNSETLRVNDLYDILGYLFLLSISQNYYGTGEKTDFAKKVATIQNELFKEVEFELITTKKNAFTRCSNSLLVMDSAINTIREDGINSTNITMLMSAIVTYFIENNITDFSNLID